MIRSSSEHAVFSWVYMNYKWFISVEIDDILLATYNGIWFGRFMQYFDTIFEYTIQEGPKLIILNINIIQSEYEISIDQIDNIIKRIIQEYWLTTTKYEVKFQK